MIHEYLPGDTRERIQDLLKEKDMTQEQLAKAINISVSTLNRYISGQTDKISTENVIAIAKVFGVTTDFLLGLTNIPYNTNFDIEALGLSADAAKNMLTKQFDMTTLNVLLNHPDFITLVRQLSKLRDGTLADSMVMTNTMLSTVGSWLKECAKVNPDDRFAMKKVIQDMKDIRFPSYHVDTSPIEATFRHLIADFENGAKECIKQTEKFNSAIMQKTISNLKTQMDDPMKLRGITPEMIVDSILGTADLSIFSKEFSEGLRQEMLPLFVRPQDAGKKQPVSLPSGD